MTIAARAIENRGHLRCHMRVGLNRLRLVNRRIDPRGSDELHDYEQTRDCDHQPLQYFQYYLHALQLIRGRFDQFLDSPTDDRTTFVCENALEDRFRKSSVLSNRLHRRLTHLGRSIMEQADLPLD